MVLPCWLSLDARSSDIALVIWRMRIALLSIAVANLSMAAIVVVSMILLTQDPVIRSLLPIVVACYGIDQIQTVE